MPPLLAHKFTGMLVEMDNNEVIGLLESVLLLGFKVSGSMAALHAQHAKQATQTSVTTPPGGCGMPAVLNSPGKRSTKPQMATKQVCIGHFLTTFDCCFI